MLTQRNLKFIARYLRTFPTIENYDKKIKLSTNENIFETNSSTKDLEEDVEEVKNYSAPDITFNDIDKGLGALLILGERMNKNIKSHEIPNLSNLIMTNYMMVENELWMPWDSLNLFDLSSDVAIKSSPASPSFA